METEQTDPRAAYTEISEGVFQHTQTGQTVLAGEVLEFAITHENSELYKCFLWDDTRAACLFRLQQCKKLLGAITITEGGTESLQIPKGD
jgi:hypothetical protein